MHRNISHQGVPVQLKQWQSPSLTLPLFLFPSLVSVCAPWHQLHHFLVVSVVQPLQADFLSPLLSFHLHHLHLLQTRAALCTAVWFPRRIQSTLERRWGRCGLLSFNAHCVDVCVWLSGDTISVWTAFCQWVSPIQVLKDHNQKVLYHVFCGSRGSFLKSEKKNK